MIVWDSLLVCSSKPAADNEPIRCFQHSAVHMELVRTVGTTATRTPGAADQYFLASASVPASPGVGSSARKAGYT